MLRSRSFILVLLTVTMVTLQAAAQTSQPVINPIHRATGANATTTTQPSTSPALDTTRVVLALAAVVALIFLLRAGLRRFAPSALARSSGPIRVIGRTSLSPRQQVIVLQVGRRLLVVGDAGQQLSTLCEISDPDEAATLIAQLQGTGKPAPREAFADVMHRADEQYAHAAPAPAQSDSSVTTARTELNGLAERVRVLAKHLKQA